MASSWVKRISSEAILRNPPSACNYVVTIKTDQAFMFSGLYLCLNHSIVLLILLFKKLVTPGCILVLGKTSKILGKISAIQNGNSIDS